MYYYNPNIYPQAEYEKRVRQQLAYMPYAEMLFISAKTGQRLPKLFETIDMVSENHAMRVSTGVLNEIMAEAVAMQQPPSDKGKRLKIFYMTQVGNKPVDQRIQAVLALAEQAQHHRRIDKGNQRGEHGLAVAEQHARFLLIHINSLRGFFLK